jgi:hypothetical protein
MKTAISIAFSFSAKSKPLPGGTRGDSRPSSVHRAGRSSQEHRKPLTFRQAVQKTYFVDLGARGTAM